MEKKIEQIAVKRGYVVTEEGVLLNSKGVEVGFSNDTTYHCTNVRVSNKHKRFFTHRLQAFQKYGNKLYEEGVVVRHKDGDYLNNSWDNILIGTESQNQMDIPKQIRIKRAKNAASSLIKYDKEVVREYHKKSQSYKETMKEFGITSKGTLHYILNS